jgi:hypothetical protein
MLLYIRILFIYLFYFVNVFFDPDKPAGSRPRQGKEEGQESAELGAAADPHGTGLSLHVPILVLFYFLVFPLFGVHSAVNCHYLNIDEHACVLLTRLGASFDTLERLCHVF